MKKSKIAILTAGILFISVLASAQLLNKRPAEEEEVDLKEQVRQYKRDAMLQLEPYRYDGAKITYFIYKPYEQLKEVEVFFFNTAEYKLAFNSNGIQGEHKLTLEIYDRPSTMRDRTLLYKKEGISPGEFSVTSKQLVDEFFKKNEGSLSEVEKANFRLKKAYINYLVPSIPKTFETDPKTGEKSVVTLKGAMVLAMGYSNI